MSSRVAIPTVAANTGGGAIANVDNQEVAALAAAIIRLCPLHAELVAAGLAPPDNFSVIEWKVFRLNPNAAGAIFFSFDVTDGVGSLPIEGATVFVTDAEGHTDQAVTNSSGTARFPNDPSGAFVAGDGFYYAEAPGFFQYPLSGQVDPTTPVAIVDSGSFVFQMAPVGPAQTFDFMVTDAGTTLPLLGAQCRILQNGVEVFNGITDAGGVANVPLSANVLAGAGSHVIVTAVGYDPFDVAGWDVTLAQPFPVGLNALVP